ncbi:hypothetical protein M433DRAFT_142898 [Acidomyces richmondensis BFW]|nr:MAG: hypothetical protein FE78DRAFT_78659 [Acidomyces sp. 'richmondensis']KYG40195.1 hypothetical protein M433DRAFT_148494 [Acidomyces richmondensis BFW]KYG46533.1 hypothetical protein M433DRAFT_142898 [Acidomyces richmondensis BFW]
MQYRLLKQAMPCRRAAGACLHLSAIAASLNLTVLSALLRESRYLGSPQIMMGLVSIVSHIIFLSPITAPLPSPSFWIIRDSFLRRAGARGSFDTASLRTAGVAR